MGCMIPLAKIDVERRLVVGVAALEEPDRQGEIMDYATAKPEFVAWSDRMHKASGGKSKGNLRAMHERNVAGKIVDISFDDDAKRIEVVAKIIDDNEWKKCLEGAYTGFSIGGGYRRKWPDGTLTRYTPKVGELSLVDLPAMPGAQFAELLKGHGIVSRIALGPRPPTFGTLLARQPLTYSEYLEAYEAAPLRKRDHQGLETSLSTGIGAGGGAFLLSRKGNRLAAQGANAVGRGAFRVASRMHSAAVGLQNKTASLGAPQFAQRAAGYLAGRLKPSPALNTAGGFFVRGLRHAALQRPLLRGRPMLAGALVGGGLGLASGLTHSLFSSDRSDQR